MKRVLCFLCLVSFAFVINGFSQATPAQKSKKPEAKSRERKVEVKHAIKKNLPESFKVKYQGGLFGFSKKQKGTIRFDDINERLLFFGKDGKEQFSIPYASIVVVQPSAKKIQSGTGRVVGAAPLPGSGLLGGLIKKKKNYLVVQFNDPDVKARGTINFLLDTGKLVASAVSTLGQKAEMKPRGDAYIRSSDY